MRSPIWSKSIAIPLIASNLFFERQLSNEVNVLWRSRNKWPIGVAGTIPQPTSSETKTISKLSSVKQLSNLSWNIPHWVSSSPKWCSTKPPIESINIDPFSLIDSIALQISLGCSINFHRSGLLFLWRSILCCQSGSFCLGFDVAI